MVFDEFVVDLIGFVGHEVRQVDVPTFHHNIETLVPFLTEKLT